MGNDGVGDLGNVEESMATMSAVFPYVYRESLHQINGPVVGNSGLGEVPSVHAELSVVESVGIGKIADNGLGSSVVASPVSSPSWLTTVLTISWAPSQSG
jgi:hypothetical protein